MTSILPPPESNTLEWKEKTPEVNKILRTVIGFANQFGGRLIIGIRDDGTVKGLTPDEIHSDLEMLSQAIYDGCTPSVVTHIYPVTLGNKNTLVIDVSEGMNKPYFVKSLGAQKGTFVRVGRSTLLASAEIVEEIRWRSKGRSYDTRPLASTTTSDLSETKFSAFRKQLTLRQRSAVGPVSEWEKMKLVSSQGSFQEATIGGLLLFGQDPQLHLPEAKILCSHFKGTSGRDAIAHLECSGTLFDQHTAALNFIEHHTPSSFTIRKNQKTEELAVPRVAIREALSNLLVHRDYAMNAPSKIAIFADRMEFFSPGVFPGPFSKLNLESGLTYIRNQTITLFFHKAGIIERLGTGFTTILSTYRALSDIEPEIIEGDGFVKCVLPFLAVPGSKNSSSKNSSEKGSVATEKIFEERRIRLLFHRQGKVTAIDIENEFQISRSTAIRILGRLIEHDKIKKEGKGPKSAYVWL